MSAESTQFWLAPFPYSRSDESPDRHHTRCRSRVLSRSLRQRSAAKPTQISELGQAQRRVGAVASVSDRAAVTTVEPVPRIALTQQEACASLGCSEEFFVEHIRPHLRVSRRGRKRLFPVAELRRAVDEMAENVF